MDEFRRIPSPYKNADALDESYQPEDILGRDDELDEIHRVLQPIINNEPPQNAFLYGLSGLGKTACMRYKIDALTEAAANYDDIAIESVWLNCDELTSSYQVAIAIANTLLPADEILPKSGLPKSQVYETMFETLDALGTSDETGRDYILVVLDEVDNIGTNDRILYQFPRARANGKVEQVWPAVIGISNDVTFKEQLSTKVTSSLCDREIVFSRYNAVQLAAIIRQRVGVAFTDEAVGEDVIQLCAAYAVREGGDARYALDLLKVAADTARDRGDDAITEADLNDARAQVEDTRVLESVLSLNRHEQLAAAAIVHKQFAGELPARRRELYSLYAQFATEVGIEPNKYRRFHDYIDNMSMLGLIGTNEVNKGIGSDSYYEHTLRSLEAEMVFTALTSDDREEDDMAAIPPALREYAAR